MNPRKTARSVSALAVWCTCAATAFAWGDDFDDNHRNPAFWTYGAQANGVLTETNQRLEYTCAIADPLDSGAHFELLYELPHDSAWTATVNVHFEDTAHSGAVAPWLYAVGCNVYNSADADDYLYLRHQYGSSVGEAWALNAVYDGVFPIATAEQSTGADDGRLRIEWDGSSSFSTHYDGGAGFFLLKRFYVDEWAMAPGETFTLKLCGQSTGCALTDGGKLYLDNFELVPGPQTDWTGAAGGWFDANNWSDGLPTGVRSAHVENGGTAQLSSGEAQASEVHLGMTGAGTLDWTGGDLVTASVSVGPGGVFNVRRASLPVTTHVAGGLVSFFQDANVEARLQIDSGVVDAQGHELTILSDAEMTGGSLLAGSQRLPASFQQSGGEVDVGGSIMLAGNWSVQDGEVRADSLRIADNASGFYQEGGTVTVRNVLVVGDGDPAWTAAGMEGMYGLVGGDLFVTGEARIGDRAPGWFTHQDGNHIAETVYVGYRTMGGDAPPEDQGVYELTGGRLTVTGGLHVGHWLDGNGASGRLDLNGEGVISADVLNVGIEYGGAGQSGRGLISWGGGSLEANTIHIGPAGRVESWAEPNWAITGQLNVEGGHLELQSSVLVVDGGGAVAVSDGNCVANGGLTVGETSTGAFTQTGGIVDLSMAMGGLILGGEEGSHGTYNLHDGNCNAPIVCVGRNGTGTFNHTGGDLLPGEMEGLVIGKSPNSVGTYNLSGDGRIASDPMMGMPPMIRVGWEGTGTFNQSGGVVEAGRLAFGSSSMMGEPGEQPPGGTGVYNLTGGELHVGLISMSDGEGTLVVDGGDMLGRWEDPEMHPNEPPPPPGFFFGDDFGGEVVNGHFTLAGPDGHLWLGNRDMFEGFPIRRNNRFTQNGGTVMACGLDIGSDMLEDAGHPTYEMNGGELLLVPGEWEPSHIWVRTRGRFMQTGGSAVLQGGSLRVFGEGHGDPNAGVFTISGGTFRVVYEPGDPEMGVEGRGGLVSVGDNMGMDGNGVVVVAGGTLVAGAIWVHGPSEWGGSAGYGTLRMAGGRLALSGMACDPEAMAGIRHSVIAGRLEGHGTIVSGSTVGFSDRAVLAPSGGVLTLDAELAPARNMGEGWEVFGQQPLLLPLDIPANAGLRTRGVLAGSIANAGLLASYGGALRLTGEVVNTGTLGNAAGSTLYVHPWRLEHTGSVEVQANGGVSFNVPIVNQPGQEVRLLGGTLTAPQVTNEPGASMTGMGTISADLTNRGTTDFFGPISIFGNVTNEQGAELQIRNGDLHVVGDTVNDGLIKVRNGQAYFEGDLIDSNEIDIDPAIAVVVGDLHVTQQGFVRVDAASTLQLMSDLHNASTRNVAFDLSAGTLQFHGDGVQELEAAGADIGADVEGWVENFSIGHLVVEAGALVSLVDLADNRPGGEAEAVYVDELVIKPYGTIELNGLRLYYLRGGDGASDGVPKELFPGDGDLDGDVDYRDYLTMKRNVAVEGADWLHGDMNGDGLVDRLDLHLLAANLGAQTQLPAAGGEQPIPEPATIALLAAAVPLLLRRRRRT